MTCYRNASFLEVRLRADVAAGKGRSAPRGEISEFTAASRRRMLELMAKVEQVAVPFFVTLTRVEKIRTAKGAFAYAAKRYVAKKEEMPELEHKPGRFWGVVGRKNLPLGKREVREVSAKEAVQIRRFIRRYRWANTPPEKRKSMRMTR
jgi:hypothetical protein